MTDFEKQLYDLSLIPVIRIETADWAEPLAHALCGGGLPAAEVTFRTPCAAEAIRRMKEAEPDMLVGAGTVLTPAQADEAAAAGTSFIVSPGLNRSVVEHCLSLGIPVVPGCATPSDVECAIGLGLTTVKFFPAEPSGGLKMLRAMSGPYGGIRFMPTGGITPANLSSYLSCPAVLACGGSFMIDEEAMRRGDFGVIRTSTRQTLSQLFAFRLYHVGISAGGDRKAEAAAGLLSSMFGVPVREIPGALFVGDLMEIVRAKGRGTHGHIGISTPHLARAVACLSRAGFAFDEGSRVLDEKGHMTTIYFRDEVLGFALHLTERKE